MLKKTIIGLLLTSSLFAQNFFEDFFKYSTAYASFSLNAPRYQDDRFAIIGGLSTGDLVFERDERELKPDFQKSFGIRKIGRFKYEPKRGVRNAGVAPIQRQRLVQGECGCSLPSLCAACRNAPRTSRSVSISDP